jgi:hypothetical protein
MTNPLIVSRSKNGNFRVSVASNRQEEWSDARLHDFLIANGYTPHDASACVNEAKAAHEIQIGLPTDS